MPEDKRCSQKVKLSIPLRIHGIDGKGRPYRCDARTIDLDRHGARIRVSRPLGGGQTIHVFNVVNRREADFRVAGPVSPLTKAGGVFGVLGPVSRDPTKRRACGVECLDTNLNFWGITFPRAAEREPPSPSALLQCRKCQATALLNISLVEVDVLETAGILSWPCDTCGEMTPWGYARKGSEKQPSRDTPAGEPSKDLHFRKHRHVHLQLPMKIRKYSGDVEVTKCEDISKGGLCFISQKHYYTGEGILVACPYNPGNQNIEVEAQIVRQEDVEDTNRRIYGVEFGSVEPSEITPLSRAPKTRRSFEVESPTNANGKGTP
jgi:PilZ domain